MLAISTDASLDLAAALDALRTRGHRLILCEGGPRTLGALVAEGLVDELFLTTSPLLAGRATNRSRPALVEGIELLPATTVGFELLTLRRAGSHLFSRYCVSRPGAVGGAS
jgi:riboflavin biosynthesis pyrimidine reductase